MNKITLIAGVAFLSALCMQTASAQEKFCGTDEATFKAFQADPNLLQRWIEEEKANVEADKIAFKNGYKEGDGRSMPPVYLIPVVFHVLHQNGAENISDAQIYDAMRCINEDFRKLNADFSATVPAFASIAADCEINFELARKDPSGNCTNGIDRIYTSETNVGDDGSKLNDWPRNKYLNIWVARVLSGGAAAYAMIPSTVSSSGAAGNDGIMALNTYVGSIGTSIPSHSHTLSHEIGHWINLQHCWGPTNNPGCDGTATSTSDPCYSTGPFPPAGPIDNCDYDDFVTDTPNTRGWTSCNLSGTSCSASENVQNFMEYSYCSTMFTAGQKTRMRAALTSSTASRNNLWTTANLTATGLATPAVLCKADFESSDLYNTVCQGNSLTFTDLSWNGTVTSWSWVFSGGTPATSSVANPTITYNTPGVYDVQLTVSNASGSVNTTKTGYVTVYPNTAQYPANIYSEGFEGSTIPNTDWKVINTNSGTNTWTQTSTAAATGTKSVRIVNAAANDANIDELISPTLDMTTITGTPSVTFKYANAQRTASTNDKLQVYVSSNCGNSWTLRQTIQGTTLATGGVTTSSFVPTAAQWASKTVNLTPIATSSSAMIKFKFTSGGGNNIYLDDINILSTGIDEFENDLGFSVFPNPAEDNTVISFMLADAHMTDIRVYDVLGQEITKVYSGNLGAGEHQYTVADHTALSSGVYFIRLNVDGRNFTQKLIVK